MKSHHNDMDADTDGIENEFEEGEIPQQRSAARSVGVENDCWYTSHLCWLHQRRHNVIGNDEHSDDEMLYGVVYQDLDQNDSWCLKSSEFENIPLCSEFIWLCKTPSASRNRKPKCTVRMGICYQTCQRRYSTDA